MSVLTIGDKTWQFDIAKLTNREGMAVEKATGLTVQEWTQQIARGSMSALTALVWIVRTRDEPSLAYDDVVFSLDELKVEEDPEPEPAAPENPTPEPDEATPEAT